MIKGTSKRVIVVKHPEGGAFEEAYFIVKEKTSLRKCDTKSLLAEAGRIINGDKKVFGEKKSKRVKRILARLALFISGGLVGAVAYHILTKL